MNIVAFICILAATLAGGYESVKSKSLTTAAVALLAAALLIQFVWGGTAITA